MNELPGRCPKCDGVMERGFVLDDTHDKAAYAVSRWAAGVPQKSRGWPPRGLELPVEALVPIGAFRCSACGYLEAYARPEFGPE